MLAVLGCTNADGAAALVFQVPAFPSLAGETLAWQALHSEPLRLSNLSRATFTSF